MEQFVFACFQLGSICSPLLCPPGETNVRCNPPPLTGGPACAGRHPLAMELDTNDISNIIPTFNLIRNYVAAQAFGPLLPSALSMPALQWDAELATMAGHNARSCVYGFDKCHNTENFPNSGQMVVGLQGLDTEILDKSLLLSYLMAQTLSEATAYVREQTASQNSYNANSGVTSFANWINDRSTKVGCALQRWVVARKYTYYLVCNFSANVIEGQPIYTTGSPAAGCTTGTDSELTSLCSTA